MANLKFTQEQIAAALKETRGLITLAADRLACDPDTVQRYIKRYPKLRRVVMSYRKRRVDTAELALDEAIANGEAWAVALVLKTLGKKRGYVERMESEIMGKGGSELVIRVIRDDGISNAIGGDDPGSVARIDAAATEIASSPAADQKRIAEV